MGTRPAPKSTPSSTITIDGDFSQWAGVGPGFIDDIGDTTPRSHLGFAGPTSYTNDSARNDIAVARVARDGARIYFYVRTAGPLSPSSDRAWMQLLVDADHDPTTGWNGFDFLINRSRATSTASVEKNVGDGWSWERVADAPIQFGNNEIELSVGRDTLGATSAAGPLVIDFKWVDNLPDYPTAMDFIDKGDSAPNGRFKYRFVEDPATAPAPAFGADAGQADEAAAGNGGIDGGSRVDESGADATLGRADENDAGGPSRAGAAAPVSSGGCSCAVARNTSGVWAGGAAFLCALVLTKRRGVTRRLPREHGDHRERFVQ